MPVPVNPSTPEFYVYTLEVCGVPFYVAEGRSSRASDRPRYVRYLMGRELAAKPVKWVFSNKVVAELLRCGEDVWIVNLHEGLTRDEALRRELVEIKRLLKDGYVLANHQDNPQCPADVETIVRSVCSRGSAGYTTSQPPSPLDVPRPTSPRLRQRSALPQILRPRNKTRYCGSLGDAENQSRQLVSSGSPVKCIDRGTLSETMRDG